MYTKKVQPCTDIWVEKKGPQRLPERVSGTPRLPGPHFELIHGLVNAMEDVCSWPYLLARTWFKVIIVIIGPPHHKNKYNRGRRYLLLPLFFLSTRRNRQFYFSLFKRQARWTSFPSTLPFCSELSMESPSGRQWSMRKFRKHRRKTGICSNS